MLWNKKDLKQKRRMDWNETIKKYINKNIFTKKHHWLCTFKIHLQVWTLTVLPMSDSISNTYL